jgi:hypothetical protein
VTDGKQPKDNDTGSTEKRRGRPTTAGTAGSRRGKPRGKTPDPDRRRKYA